MNPNRRIPSPDEIEALLLTDLETTIWPKFQRVLVRDDDLGATVRRHQAAIAERYSDFAFKDMERPNVRPQGGAGLNEGKVHLHPRAAAFIRYRELVMCSPFELCRP